MMKSPSDRSPNRPQHGSPFIFDMKEVSGSLADLGIMIPLAIGLIVVCGVQATTLFFVTGAMYILTGLVYRLPIPIQPLKAASALAIAGGLGVEAIAAAGWTIALLLGVLALTGLAGKLSSLFTRPVIRGIQLGVGLILLKKGFLLGLQPSFASGTIGLPGMVAIGLGVGVFCLLLLGHKWRSFPSVLAILFVSGLVVLGFSGWAALPALSFGPQVPQAVFPSWSNWVIGITVLALPQIPLTLGNAVVATEDCAKTYFGESGKHVTSTRLSTTLAIGNWFAAFVGSMPMCHGSGGLTAHYRLGARSGAAPVMLGAALIILALVFGGSTHSLFLAIPPVTIGVLMAYIGLQHISLMKDMLHYRWKLTLALAIGTIGLVTSNLALAFIVGILVDRIQRALPQVRRRPTHS